MTYSYRLATTQRSGLALILGLILTTLSGGMGGKLAGEWIQQNLAEGIAPALSNSLAAHRQPSTLPLAPVPFAPVEAITPITTQISRGPVALLMQKAKEDAELHNLLKQKRLNFKSGAFQGAIVSAANLQSDRAVALTFDDGPWEGTTDQILDILAQEGVIATFFWVGQSVQNSPDVARRVVNAGHEIGNHTWHHYYEPMDEVTAASEIEVAADIFYQETGIETSLFRPPGGYLDNGLADYALNMGYTVVMWSVAAGDTESYDAQAYINNVLNNAYPGSIILLHDGGGDRSQTVAALPAIIQGLRDQGYRFVTVRELLDLEAAGA